MIKDERLEIGSIPPTDWGPGFRLWERLRGLLAQRGPEGTTSLVRMASHLVILLVAVGVLVISRLELPRWDIAENQEAQPQTSGETLVAASGDANSGGAGLVRAAVPFTLIPERPRIDIITHTVVAGDTLYGIAEKYSISVETLMWANGMELNPDLLRLGQQLTVLPIDGVYHSVEKGDTLDSIAKKYKANTSDIVKYELNDLNQRTPTIAVGQKLVVPGGTKPQVVRQVQIYAGPAPANASRGTGRFVWPTSGSISQNYKTYHRALDIGSRIGAPVKASDSGYVAAAGWSNLGYGNYVVIDHGNGFQTLYAHLNSFSVSAGQSVAQGTVIGQVGNTGNSTGPHLHFEIIQGGVQRNPYNYLP